MKGPSGLFPLSRSSGVKRANHLGGIIQVSEIIKAESLKKVEEYSTVVLFVVSVGPDAYRDTEKFPSGPWCKEGDFILTRAYSGTRLKIYGREFRIINDDQVDAVVDDPRGITRA